MKSHTWWQDLRERRLDFLLGLVLALVTFAIYAQAARFDFVNYDDPAYLTNNLHLRAGISAEGLGWAWTSGEFAHWIPLTRMSELLDYQLFGLRAGPPHIVNMIWHVLGTLLFFAFLVRATAAPWRAALAAFLFALHPLHVESVAWVTERKDVLSGFFFFLTLWAYVRYVERPTTGRYLQVLAWFSLGLMSKATLVALPIVLVLLDFWPLRRWNWKAAPWKEKMPFVGLSAAASIVSYLAAAAAGSIVSGHAAPLEVRVGHALVAYCVYIIKTAWPVKLAAFYPYQDLPTWQPVVAGLALAALTVAFLPWSPRRPAALFQSRDRQFQSRDREEAVRAVALFRNRDRQGAVRPYLAVGWLWYLAMLLPVSGVVQTGEQAYADHFMYLPMAGLLIALVWWLPANRLAIAGAAAVCVAAASVAWMQIGYWRNSEALWRHALEVTQDNYLAHYNLGSAIADTPGRMPEAIEEYRAALRIRPNHAAALTNLGAALSRIPGKVPEAIDDLQAAVRLKPDDVLARNNLGAVLSQVPGRLPDAIAEYQAALRFDPGNASVHRNLGKAYGTMERWPEAAAEEEAALRIDSSDAAAHADLAAALSMLPGRLPDAIGQFQEAARLRPAYVGDADFHKNLGSALANSGRMQDAISEFQAAIRLRPEFAEAHNNLGFALANSGRMTEAVAQFAEAVRLQPGYRDAQANLGVTLSKLPGHNAEALEHLEIALRLRPDPALQQLVTKLKH